jgi:primase-polymerase (primpol)-like protein
MNTSTNRILRPDVAGIPIELRRLPNWVCWRLEEIGGDSKKIPYCASSGRRASSTDPATWSNFGSAWRAYEADVFNGLGFVFAEGGGLVGIDLDHCIDNDAIAADAQAVIDDLNSYAEVSVSGTGVHIIARGTLPGGKGRRRGSIEMYAQGRYFTITGRAWGEPKPISEAQPAIDRLCDSFKGKSSETTHATRTTHGQRRICPDDRQLLLRAAQARNGFKFARLWAGDTSDYGGDDSRADLALLGMLLFWTGGDVQRADMLFRQSGLMREKWNRDDYRRMTLEKLSAGGEV